MPAKEALLECVLTFMLGGAVQWLKVEPPRPEETTRDLFRCALMPLVTDEKAELCWALFRMILSEWQRFPEVLTAARRFERPFS